MLLLYLLSSRLSRFFGYCRSGSYTLSARRLADYTAGTEFHRSHKDIFSIIMVCQKALICPAAATPPRGFIVSQRYLSNDENHIMR